MSDGTKVQARRILVTGCTSPLGEALLRYWVDQESVQLLATSRSAQTHGFRLGDNLQYLPGIDLTNEVHLDKLSSWVDNRFAGPFEVVNAVGYYSGQEPFGQTSFAEATRILNSNFLAVYGAAHSLVPLMVAKGGGHFLAFSCNSVRYQYPWMAPFSASKAAVESLICSLANEFSGNGITANAIVMATMLTARERQLKPHGDHANWLRPEDVIRVVDDLLKDHSRLLNGNAIRLYRHSETFFNESYFNRIRRE